MDRVVLYFGSFNPIHRGHLAIAERILELDLADELWFVVSPQNPFKQSSELAMESQRLDMAKLAIAEVDRCKSLKVCDIEFDMPRPSMTIDTIERLRAEHVDKEFSLLVGSDNAMNIGRWKQSQRLLGSTKVFIYPREGFDASKSECADSLELLEGVELLDFTATDLRKMIASGASIESILKVIPENVYQYIMEHGLYK